MVLSSLLLLLSLGLQGQDVNKDPEEIFQSGRDQILNGDLVQAVPTIEQALELFKAEKNNEGISKSLMALGYINEQSDTLGAAVIYYFESLKFDPDDYYRMATYNNLGKIYKNLGKHVEAMEFYKAALEAADSYDDDGEKAGVLYNIGNLLKNGGNCMDAKDYYLDALTITQRINDETRTNRTLNALGLCYKNFGDYQNAREYFETVIDRATGSKYLGRSYHNIAWTYYMEGNHSQAIYYGKKALEFKSGQDRVITLIDLGLSYKGNGQIEEAFNSWNKAIAIGVRENVPEEFVVYKHLYQAQEDDRALHKEYTDTYISFAENHMRFLQSLENKSYLHDFDLQIQLYRDRVHQQDLQRNLQKWIWIAVISASVVGLLVWAINVLFRRKNRKEAERMMKELL